MVEVLLDQVRAWAMSHPDVRAVALVGSHARGTASRDSDVDLVLLTEHPSKLADDTSWVSNFGTPEKLALEDWGRVTSVRVWYRAGLEVEFGLATLAWATEPDEGTRRVLADGYRVLLDRDAVFVRLGES
jgi:predicted nucleotidyltransferase